MDVLMPQLGETVSEGKITKWFKKAGDAVQPGDNLFEIETDKVSMEVPSITAGTLSEIRVQEGAVAPVGAVVAVIAGAGGAASPQPAAPAPVPAPKAAAPVAAAPAVAPRPAPAPSRAANAGSFAYANPDAFFEVRTPTRNFGKAVTAGGTSVTPLARRLAGENGIDLSRVSGSGPHGRIVASDVEAAIASGGGRGAAMATGASADQVKALYQGAEILLLDEPTAVLVPDEVDKLFDNVHAMTKAGKSIVFISHKLGEVVAISDRVTVLRNGRVTGHVDGKGKADTRELAQIGRAHV